MSESRSAVSADAAARELARLRENIDKVDEVLVRLLNQRTKYAIEIGRIKGVLDLPLYSPEREKQVLTNIEQWSEGPLEPAAMRRLFERIIDEARRIEREASRS
ncbi:MAG TPA: chorismate mutase [Thermoanaerobaculia bacterium]|jgi:chorismate mutase|nr:chorismate mutase [Thermoanaerobaculia bacterium]